MQVNIALMQIFISHAKPSIIWVFCHPNDWFNSCLGRDQLVNGLQAALPANRPACPLFPSFYSLGYASNLIEGQRLFGHCGLSYSAAQIKVAATSA